MPRSLTLAPHLSVEPLGQCYKRATTPAAARRSQPLWLIGQGHTATAAPALVGLRHKWVHALVHRYTQRGAGLTDRRPQHPGRAPLLAPDQQHALAQALQPPPAEGGRWTGRNIAAWIARTTRRPTSPSAAGTTCGVSATSGNAHGRGMRRRPPPRPTPPGKQPPAARRRPKGPARNHGRTVVAR
ncbi:MAG: helix-turn-helix domain-containing protein [Chloroflexota bacterium]|nr:helix-turn-helix domain-containing protein [Chloroflexota bacterium]